MTQEEKEIYEELKASTEKAERFLKNGNTSPVLKSILDAIRRTQIGRELTAIFMEEAREKFREFRQNRKQSRQEVKEAVKDVTSGELPDYTELDRKELLKVAKKLKLEKVSRLSVSDLRELITAEAKKNHEQIEESNELKD